MAEPQRSNAPADGAPTDPLGRVPAFGAPRTAPVSSIRLFGSHTFFRLWLAMVVSSLGDWIGFAAVAALAARIGGSSPEAAVGLVLSARLIPGFFLGSVAGVLVDRWDRKKVMVVCDIGRGAVLATLPFVDTIPGLFLASLLLEVLTLMWAPAKEATVPNLVPADFLANANSLSLVAAYGTFPVGAALFALLAKVPEWLGGHDALAFLRITHESVAIYFDVVTFFCSALMISTLALPRAHARSEGDGGIGLSRVIEDLREGWRFIGTTPLVRSVIVGLATGLIGGGMVVPLGPVFSAKVLGAGTAGFGLLLTALGTGVALGIVGLSVVQRRLPHERVFVGALLAAGVFIIAGASMSSLTPALLLVGCLGLCAGAVYVLGYTLLQTNVGNDMRGRTFATLNTLVRFCLLLAFTLAPFLSSLLDSVSSKLLHRSIAFGGVHVALPGVRLTLWLGGLIILGAGTIAAVTCWGHGSPTDADVA